MTCSKYKVVPITCVKLANIKKVLLGNDELRGNALYDLDVALGVEESEDFNPILDIIFDFLNGHITLDVFIHTMRRLDVI